MRCFLEPKTICIIGASENKDKVGGILVEKLKSFRGNSVYVNPHYETINKKKCYKSVLDCKDKIDLAVIAVPHNIVKNAVIECKKKKIEGVIIISSGFSEVGNYEEEKKLMNVVKGSKTRILGPNCFGVCNPRLKLDVTFAKSSPRKGGVAFISQSGALWSYIADIGLDIGFSGFVSLGNMTDLSFDEMIEYFINDKNTKSIILYVEKLKDGKRFLEICKKSKKKIYAIKAGSSEVGSKAAFSHTGSLATDYEIYKGAFKQAGVILCESIEEALERASRKNIDFEMNKLKLPLIGKKVFILTNAGGAGALASDYLSKQKFEIIQNDDIKNPLDVLGTAKAEDYLGAIHKIKNLEYDFILLIVTPQSMTDMESISWMVLDHNLSNHKKIIPLFLGKPSIKTSKLLLNSNSIEVITNFKSFLSSLVI
jgi:acyl-CoA synthetase (NDP forming)